MRIGIDCSELSGKSTGVGRFLRGILLGLKEVRHAHEFFLYHLGDTALPEDASFVPRVTGGTGRKILREQLFLPGQIEGDAIGFFYTPRYWLPLRVRVPAAFSLHDVSFFSHPEWFRRRDRMKYAVLTRTSAGKAKGILTDSQFSRGEILRHLRVGGERVAVIPVPFDSTLARAGASRTGAGEPPMVLSVGSLFQRRRTDSLLRAFALLAQTHPTVSLRIAGENRTWPRVDYGAIARELGIAGRVVFSGYTEEPVLRELYARATLVVYLSEYEGFGLPPLEACALGVPVVTSRGSSLEEVFSGAALLVDNSRPDEVAAAMATLLDDEPRRRALRAAGLALASRYTPGAAAAAFLKSIERIASL